MPHPIEWARQEHPALIKRAPHWRFTPEAIEDIMNFWRGLSEADIDQMSLEFEPLSELIVELDHDVLQVMVTSKSPAHAYITSIRKDIPPQGPNQVLAVQYSFLGLNQEEKEVAGSTGWICYLVRSMFMNRYIDRRSTSRVRRLIGNTGKRVEEVVVKWDAPTPRYIRPEPSKSSHVRGPVCQYDIKEFTRRLKSGKEVPVKAHKRGNPDIPRKTRVKIVPSTR